MDSTTAASAAQERKEAKPRQEKRGDRARLFDDESRRGANAGLEACGGDNGLL